MNSKVHYFPTKQIGSFDHHLHITTRPGPCLVFVGPTSNLEEEQSEQ